MKGVEHLKNSYDKHHIFFVRREWSCGNLNRLRLHKYCVVDIPKDTLHRYIHVNMEGIPAPRGQSASEALRHLGYLEGYGAISTDDPLEKRLAVLISLFECIEQPTADALKKQLQLVHDFKKAPH